MSSQTKQPKWKFLVNLGDANPEEEGGVFVYVDETGVYPPEAEILEPQGHGRWMIYRVVLTKCTFENGVLSDNPFHKDKPVWFADRIEQCASTCDNPQIIDHLCLDDIHNRARAYQSLWEYFGLMEFDSYPLNIDPLAERYTDGEIPKRIGRYFGEAARSLLHIEMWNKLNEVKAHLERAQATLGERTKKEDDTEMLDAHDDVSNALDELQKLFPKPATG